MRKVLLVSPEVPPDDLNTVRLKVGGVDPIAFRFIAGDERIGLVFDVHYGSYVHTVRLTPSGKKLAVWDSKRR